MREPQFDQADQIAALFGGDAELADAIGVHRTATYRWRQPEPQGTDGLIPTRRVREVLEAAKRLGIKIPDRVWIPKLRR